MISNPKLWFEIIILALAARQFFDTLQTYWLCISSLLTIGWYPSVQSRHGWEYCKIKCCIEQKLWCYRYRSYLFVWWESLGWDSSSSNELLTLKPQILSACSFKGWKHTQACWHIWTCKKLERSLFFNFVKKRSFLFKPADALVTTKGADSKK